MCITNILAHLSCLLARLLDLLSFSLLRWRGLLFLLSFLFRGGARLLLVFFEMLLRLLFWRNWPFLLLFRLHWFFFFVINLLLFLHFLRLVLFVEFLLELLRERPISLHCTHWRSHIWLARRNLEVFNEWSRFLRFFCRWRCSLSFFWSFCRIARSCLRKDIEVDFEQNHMSLVDTLKNT